MTDKSKKNPRSEMMKFRVTPEERETIETSAYRSCRTVSRYLRDCALGKNVTILPGAEALAEEFRRIGNNLNQLTRAANAGLIREVSLSEMKEEVKKIWQSLNSLSRDVR